MDLALLAVFKYTGGLAAYPHPGWSSQHAPLPECTSLFEGQYLVSIGFVIVMLMCVPLGYVNLDDNVVVQEGIVSVTPFSLTLPSLGAFFAMIAIIAEWMVQFFMVGLEWSRVPFVGT